MVWVIIHSTKRRDRQPPPPPAPSLQACFWQFWCHGALNPLWGGGSHPFWGGGWPKDWVYVLSPLHFGFPIFGDVASCLLAVFNWVRVLLGHARLTVLSIGYRCSGDPRPPAQVHVFTVAALNPPQPPAKQHEIKNTTRHGQRQRTASEQHALSARCGVNKWYSVHGGPPVPCGGTVSPPGGRGRGLAIQQVHGG